MDKHKLLLAGYAVEDSEENENEFFVTFYGPKDSIYEAGKWKVHVLLPENYPYKSPSIGFVNKIYHPNVDEAAGSICLDVINQTWSPLFDLVNVFNIFLPQLLLYPNPSDPLNGSAADLLNNSPKKYEEKVRLYVEKYAKNEDFVKKEEESKKEEEKKENEKKGEETEENKENQEDNDDPSSVLSKPSEEDENSENDSEK